MTEEEISMFLVSLPEEYLLTCPRCGSHELYLYNKGYTNLSDCVACKKCSYFNLLSKWNTGISSEHGWDTRWMTRVRFLERLCNFSMVAKYVEDRRIKND